MFGSYTAPPRRIVRGLPSEQPAQAARDSWAWWGCCCWLEVASWGGAEKVDPGGASHGFLLAGRATGCWERTIPRRIELSSHLILFFHSCMSHLTQFSKYTCSHLQLFLSWQCWTRVLGIMSIIMFVPALSVLYPWIGQESVWSRSVPPLSLELCQDSCWIQCHQTCIPRMVQNHVWAGIVGSQRLDGQDWAGKKLRLEDPRCWEEMSVVRVPGPPGWEEVGTSWLMAGSQGTWATEGPRGLVGAGGDSIQLDRWRFSLTKW